MWECIMRIRKTYLDKPLFRTKITLPGSVSKALLKNDIWVKPIGRCIDEAWQCTETHYHIMEHTDTFKKLKEYEIQEIIQSYFESKLYDNIIKYKVRINGGSDEHEDSYL